MKQRETEIIEAAIALFQRDGYKNVTMSDIAAETNISKGAVYLYFSSKEVLMTAIQAHLLESLKQYYVKLLEKDISGKEIVKSMMLYTLQFVREEAFHSIMLTRSGSNDAKNEEELKFTQQCKQLQTDIFIYVVRSLQIGRQDGSITTDVDPKLIATQLMLLIKGVINHYQNSGNDLLTYALEQNAINIDTLVLSIFDRCIAPHYSGAIEMAPKMVFQFSSNNAEDFSLQDDSFPETELVSH